MPNTRVRSLVKLKNGSSVGREKMDFVWYCSARRRIQNHKVIHLPFHERTQSVLETFPPLKENESICFPSEKFDFWVTSSNVEGDYRRNLMSDIADAGS